MPPWDPLTELPGSELVPADTPNIPRGPRAGPGPGPPSSLPENPMRKRSLLVLSGVLTLAVAITTGLWVGIGGEAAESAFPPPGEAPADVARTPVPLAEGEPIPVTVYLDPACGCCSAWVEHMTAQGFEVTREYRADMVAVKQELGVRPEIASCHTALVNGYVVEGHVPGEVVRQFLAEAPAVRGLTAPGMPVGSPGMEMGGLRDPYDVLTFTSEGVTAVYSREGRN